jgi:hypothetical protein
MSDDRDNDFWLALERRVSDIDAKVANLQRDYQRDYTELARDIRENTGRVNNGLSPSIQKALQDNSDNKLSIASLGNVVEKAVIEMKSIVRETTDLTKLMLSNFEQNKLKPVESEVDLIKKTFVYGLIGMMIVFAGQKGINFVWDKFFKTDTTTAVEPISAVPPIKRK